MLSIGLAGCPLSPSSLDSTKTDSAVSRVEQEVLEANPLNGKFKTEFVYRGKITDAEVSQLRKESRLQTLELFDASRLTPSVLTQSLIHWPDLKKLRIECAAVDDVFLQQMVAQLVNLEVLNIPDSQITDSGVALISNLPKLTLLRLGSPSVTDGGIAVLAEAPALRFIHLLNVSVTDAGLRAFHDMSQLESLYIDGGQETEDGISELLRRNPRLHFHRNQLHVAGDPNADGH